MNELGLAYLAGFFDGEGSIGIAKHKSKSCRRGYTFELFIQVTNTDKPILELYKNTFGGSICAFKSPLRLPMWRWSISSKKAKKFLNQIVLYLTIKRKQARLAIAFQEDKKHNRFLSDKDYSLQEKCRIRISEFNRKGKKIITSRG